MTKMHGIDDDDGAERWFGALRSIRTDPLGEARYAWVRRERLRAFRWVFGVAALLVGGPVACGQLLAFVGRGNAEVALWAITARDSRPETS